MQVLPILHINDKSTINKNNKNNFQGKVDKSVYKYVNEASLHHKNQYEAKTLSNYTIKKLENFMTPLHKDTTFSIVEDLHAKEFWLPFPSPHAVLDWRSIGDFQSLFLNKKIKSEFSMSRKCERIRDKSSGDYYDIHKDFLGTAKSSDALENFKVHIDNIVNFFNKHNEDFSVDSILYNQRLKDIKYHNALTPEFISNCRYKNLQKQKLDFYSKSFNENIFVEKIAII